MNSIPHRPTQPKPVLRSSCFATAIGTLELSADLIIVTNYDAIESTLEDTFEDNHGVHMSVPSAELDSRMELRQSLDQQGLLASNNLHQHRALNANESYGRALTTQDKLINDTLLASEQPPANDNDIYPRLDLEHAAKRLLMKAQTNNLACWQMLSTSLPSLFSFAKPVSAIRLLQIEGPKSVQEGSSIKLRCLYDSKGDKLSSLSWHKDGKEFYRHQAYDRKLPALVFNQSGINVDVSSCSSLS